MKIAISVESTNDLTKELINENDIKVIPYEITLGDRDFLDGEVSTQEMFDYVDKNGILPKTTAINEYRYTEYFESLLKDYDGIVHISLSSGISSSCSNAIRASKNVKNCYVVDSQSLSTGIGLLALYARDLANEGKTPEEIYKVVQARVTSLQVSFVIERLDYLYKGGRCSALSLFGANLLKIRPRIVLKNGVMGPDKKYRGSMDKVVEKYAKEVFNEFDTPDLKRVFITYSSATPEMIKSARKIVDAIGFENVYESHAGCTITSHCGANTIGILYFNDGEKI